MTAFEGVCFAFGQRSSGREWGACDASGFGEEMRGIQNDEGLAVVDRCESDVACLGHGKDGFDGNFPQLGDSGAFFVAALVKVWGWFYWHMFFRDNLRRSAPCCAGDVSEGGLWREFAQLLVTADGV